ncbi:hypothetical protein Tco_1055966 [Tanacetum coccineum]|uniref:Uncharacterized protein n=1 Tax=Tanacetum coccineum TaxID=301880 RepID=A0ABQ5H1E3_9ASTR
MGYRPVVEREFEGSMPVKYCDGVDSRGCDSVVGGDICCGPLYPVNEACGSRHSRPKRSMKKRRGCSKLLDLSGDRVFPTLSTYPFITSFRGQSPPWRTGGGRTDSCDRILLSNYRSDAHFMTEATTVYYSHDAVSAILEFISSVRRGFARAEYIFWREEMDLLRPRRESAGRTDFISASVDLRDLTFHSYKNFPTREGMPALGKEIMGSSSFWTGTFVAVDLTVWPTLLIKLMLTAYLFDYDTM